MKRLIQPCAVVVLLLVAAMSLISIQPVMAQQNELTGKVVDDGTGQALVGATVVLKGTQTGTTTGSDGTFSLPATAGSTLEISMIGYEKKEAAVESTSTPLTIRLSLSSSSLDQVVVIGYGTSSKADFTGAISTVSGSSVKDVPSTLMGQKLQGKVSGVQINQASGRPGAGMQFRIRGAASFSGGFQPLIVVDGQPLIGNNSQFGGISNLDPNDIEDVTVLKDAAASALYGSRASNGVILITTKHAKTGQTSVTLNVYTAWQKVPQKGRPSLMNARQFATFMNGFYEDKAKYEGRTEGIPDDYADPSIYGKGTDWYDAVLRTAPQQSYSLSFMSGTDKLSSANTITYLNQQGVLLNTGFKRYALRSNNEYRPNQHLKFGINIAPSYQIRHNSGGGLEGSRQIIGLATVASPLAPIYNADGTYNANVSSSGMLGVPNPVQQLMIKDDDDNEFRILGNIYGEVEILPNLSFKSSFNVDMGSQDDNWFNGSYVSLGFNPNLPHSPTGNAAMNVSDNYVSWTNENTLTYDLQVQKHSFKFLAGYSAQDWRRNYRSINGSNFAGDQVPWISGATTTSGTTNHEAWSMASAFGRIRYNYNQKYFVTASLRRDGSSRFGADKKYGNFPAVSASWILSNESFFPDIKALSFAKIRGSWGKTGNFNIGNYASISNITATNYVFGGTVTPGLSVTSLGNNDLTWEKTAQTDVGIDLGFLDGRITLSYDYYDKMTTGMLFATALPYSSGFTTIESNVGKVRIWGHEFQVHSQNLTGPLSWSTDFNISFNKNVVKALPPNTPFLGTKGRYDMVNVTVEGKPMAQLYGYVFEGLYKDQQDVDNSPIAAAEGSTIGTPKMRDVNGDGVITPDDKTFIGDPNPKFIFGMTNTLGYKNFDFNMIIGGQYGNKVMLDMYQDMHNLDGVFNMTTDMLPVWRSEDNPGNGKVPRTLSGTTEFYRVANSTWIVNGSYLTIKNITLGYTFDLNQLSFVKSVRLYGGIQDLWTLTDFPMGNPEANISRDNSITKYGQYFSAYPIPRTFTIGANINF